MKWREETRHERTRKKVGRRGIRKCKKNPRKGKKRGRGKRRERRIRKKDKDK